MNPVDLFECASEAAVVILEQVADPPRIAVVLGSGLGTLADRLVKPFKHVNESLLQQRDPPGRAFRK